MVAPYRKIKYFSGRTPWAGCTGRQKVATKVAHFLAQIAKLRKAKCALLFFTKKEQKKRHVL